MHTFLCIAEIKVYIQNICNPEPVSELEFTHVIDYKHKYTQTFVQVDIQIREQCQYLVLIILYLICVPVKNDRPFARKSHYAIFSPKMGIVLSACFLTFSTAFVLKMI